MANSPSGESVITRVSRLLRAFDQEHTELTAAELAERAGLSASTAHRMATAMVEEGLLERTGRGAFRIGLRLWEAGRRGTAFQSLSEVALPFMEALHITLKHNVSLSILDEDTGQIIYLERLTAGGAAHDQTRVAHRQAALSVSPGLVMLAFAPPEVQERVLAMPWDEQVRRLGITEQHLRRRLEQARQDGYVHLRGVLVNSLSGLAVPVLDRQGRARAALAMVQTMAEVNLPTQVPVMLAAGRGLSRLWAKRLSAHRPDEQS